MIGSQRVNWQNLLKGTAAKFRNFMKNGGRDFLKKNYGSVSALNCLNHLYSERQKRVKTSEHENNRMNFQKQKHLYITYKIKKKYYCCTTIIFL